MVDGGRRWRRGRLSARSLARSWPARVRPDETAFDLLETTASLQPTEPIEPPSDEPLADTHKLEMLPLLSLLHAVVVETEAHEEKETMGPRAGRCGRPLHLRGRPPARPASDSGFGAGTRLRTYDGTLHHRRCDDFCSRSIKRSSPNGSCSICAE